MNIYYNLKIKIIRKERLEKKEVRLHIKKRGREGA